MRPLTSEVGMRSAISRRRQGSFGPGTLNGLVQAPSRTEALPAAATPAPAPASSASPPAPPRHRARSAAVALAASATVLSTFGSPAVAAKNIQVERVAAGSAQVEQRGAATRITAADRTIINYSRFNVARNESVQFVQPTSKSRLLNRINSAAPSRIDGKVTANGIVYFANPAGVLFGPNAIVDVGALYAAAGHITDADFLAGINRFVMPQPGTPGGAVVNQGQLRGDVVALVGRQVTNQGVVVADSTVTMVSGHDVLLGDRNGGILVKVDMGAAAATPPAPAGTGTPDRPRMPLGAGDMYSLAVVNAGHIRAQSIQLHGGAGQAVVSGKLDASNKAGGVGGDVTVTGNRIKVSAASIDASGGAGGGSIRIGGDAHGARGPPPAGPTTNDQRR